MPALNAEHKKRVWWTTYQLDAMTGSEMGMNAAFDFEEVEVHLPSTNDLAPIDCAEFTDGTIFTAHVRLCNVRAGVLSSIPSIRDTDGDSVDTNFTKPLDLLSDWRKELPARIDFDFSQGVPQAMIALSEMRSLASVYLRFHHVRTSCICSRCYYMIFANANTSAILFYYAQSY